jgi:hypothetical protein
MKNIFLLAILFVSTTLWSQEEIAPIIICAQGTTLKADILKDNTTNLLILDSHKKEGNLLIENKNILNEKKMIRRYMLLKENDQELSIEFTNKQDGISFVLLKNVFKKTEKNKTYNLYTIATPADPTEAAYVRMRRFLLCKVVIK